MSADEHFQTKIFLKISRCVWKHLLNGITKLHWVAYFWVWSTAPWSREEGKCNPGCLYCGMLAFSASACNILNVYWVSLVLLAVKEMFKLDIFKNLPGLSLTRNTHWGKGAIKGWESSVTAKISNYSVLKALRTQDAFFFLQHQKKSLF